MVLVGSQATATISPDEVKVSSGIKRVTVFRTGAQVTREAKAAIPVGNSLIKFTGISPQIDKQSIQVKGEGAFTILSVNHQLNYFEEPAKSQRIKDLEERKIEIADQQKSAQALLAVLNEEESLLLTNKSIGGSQTGVRIDDLKATAEFYRTRLKAIKLEKLEISKIIKADQDSIQRIAAQLTELNAQQGTYTSEIVLAINSEQAIAGSFVLSYIVRNAGWFPNYDIRVKDVESPIDLTYKGNVYQTSGEAWNQVKLTLSTGDFSQTGTKPELQPWRLGFYVPSYANNYGQRRYDSGVYSGAGGSSGRISGVVMDEYGEPLIGANVMISGSTTGTVTDVNGAYSLELPPNAKNIIVSYTGFNQVETAINAAVMNIVLGEGVSLDEVVVTGSGVKRSKRRSKTRGKRQNATDYYVDGQRVADSLTPQVVQKERTTTVEFEIELPYTIPSDGKQYTVQMKDYELPAYYEYYCAPKLDPDAFLTAQVTGWEELNLLNGEANLFFEGTYLGKSTLDVQTVDDTLDISLGRDRNIVVTRKKQKEFAKKQFIGNKRTDTRAWDIEVRNKKKQPINIVVEDQFPLSTTEEIEVKHEAYEGAQLNKDTGILTWKLELGSGKSQKLNFRYAVKYPKKKRVMLE